jgi:CDP-diacylglycerol---serine O-phosphatidyltransferase
MALITTSIQNSSEDGYGPWNRRRISGRAVAPNLITLAALCSGLISIRMSIEGFFETAILAILVAALLDAFDGRLARLLGSSSRFGAELDSLADLVSFGVAPAVLYYVWTPPELGWVSWIAGMAFVAAGGLRLARFNVALDEPPQSNWQSNFFVGMPIPAGSITFMLPIYLDFAGVSQSAVTSFSSLFYCLLIAALMISRIPTFSGKAIPVPRHRSFLALLIIAGSLFSLLIATFTWTALSAATALYLLSIPLGALYFHKMKHQQELRHDT